MWLEPNTVQIPPGPLQHHQLNTQVLLKKFLWQLSFAFSKGFVPIEIANLQHYR
jgi:hypothetical protein